MLAKSLSSLLTEGEKQDAYLASNLLERVIINLQLKKENKTAQEKNHHSGYIENNKNKKSLFLKIFQQKSSQC